MWFGGSVGGPQGPSWLIHGPWPLVRWVEKRKRFIGQFGESITGLYPFGKRLMKTGLFLGVNIVVWGV